MIPSFFGPSSRQLFGVLHRPQAAGNAAGAVLVCSPFGREYMASHRSLQQLAAQLSDSGFWVLRFDFHGCGNSAGDVGASSFQQWVDDLRIAARELMATSGSRQICAVGLRLGAALAAVAASDAARVGIPGLCATVLWEPVLRGRDYLAEIHGQHSEWVRRTFPKPRSESLEWPVPQASGYPLPLELQRDIERIDLLELSTGHPVRALLLQNAPGEHCEALRNHWSAHAVDVTREFVANEKCWEVPEGGSVGLVPTETNKAIVQWITEVHR